MTIIPLGPVTGRGFIVIDEFTTEPFNAEEEAVPATGEVPRVPLPILTGPAKSPGLHPLTALTQK